MIALAENDCHRIEDSITLTRRIRQAAVSQINDQTKQETHEQQALTDAEIIASATSQFLIARGYTHSSSTETDRLDDILDKLGSFYDRWTPYSFASLHIEMIRKRLIDELNLIDTSYKNSNLFSYFLHRTAMPASELTLFFGNTGVFAPLSTDYYHAMLCQTFIKEKMQSPKCFTLKPTALQISKQHAVFPKTETGEQVFADKEQIGLFVDYICFGYTIGLLSQKAREVYSGKTIYTATDY